MQLIAEVPTMGRTYSKLKDADEKRWMVEDATKTLMNAKGFKRQMKEDKTFKKAVTEELAAIAKDAKAASSTT